MYNSYVHVHVDQLHTCIHVHVYHCVCVCVCVCVYVCVCVCVCTDILQGIGSLASTATRAEWEKAFDKTYIQPVVQVRMCVFTVRANIKCP